MHIENSDNGLSKIGIKSKSAEIAPKTRKFFSKRFFTYLIKLLIAVLVMVMLVKRVHTREIFNAFHSAKLEFIFIAPLDLSPQAESVNLVVLFSLKTVPG